MISCFTVSSPRLSPKNSNSSSRIKKKPLSINNFRGCPTIDENFVDKSLKELSDGLSSILYQDKSNAPLERLYQIVDNLQEAEHRVEVFKVLNVIIEVYLYDKLDKLLVGSTTENLLENFIKEWYGYSKKIITIKNIYLKYDRSSLNGQKFNAVQSTCIELFRSIFLLNATLKNKLSSKLQNIVDEDRTGSQINREETKSVINILSQLTMYPIVFEKEFLEQSKTHFYEEGLKIHEEPDIKKYLQHVKNSIIKETSRSYIPKETVDRVLKIVYEEMVKVHLEQILEQSFYYLMNEMSIEYLTLLYSLCLNTDKDLKFLKESFEKYTSFYCTNIVENFTDKTMIQKLIEIKDKLDIVIEKCFDKNPAFGDITKNVFTEIINAKGSDPAQSLAKYLDSKLRSKNLSEEHLVNIVSKVMVIFRYVQGKDVFEAFYRKDLARRLIFGKSTNQDEERNVISKLKEECGECFTAKLEGMFRDINVSQDINSNFKQYLVNVHPDLGGSSDISVMVLTSSFWSGSVQNYPVIFPSDLLAYQEKFRKFYSFNYSGRKLDWQTNLSHCIIRANFGDVVKELQVSLFQAIILLLFNDNKYLSATEIQELTKLNSSDLKTTLQSLISKKVNILESDSKEHDVKMNDIFGLNHKFDDKLFRIRMNQIQMRGSVEEQKTIEKNVLLDRQFQIDAAIVRILKRRRVLSHNELLAEILNAINVPVELQHLKRRIELLIEREYIRRDTTNPALYTYVA